MVKCIFSKEYDNFLSSRSKFNSNKTTAVSMKKSRQLIRGDPQLVVRKEPSVDTLKIHAFSLNAENSTLLALKAGKKVYYFELVAPYLMVVKYG